jgi:hypothetical protein
VGTQGAMARIAAAVGILVVDTELRKCKRRLSLPVSQTSEIQITKSTYLTIFTVVIIRPFKIKLN